MKNILPIIFIISFLAVTAQEDPSPFITTWETTAANETITIPTDTANHTYSYTVDWGDGSTDNNTYTKDATHEYADAGTYMVTINGGFPHIRFAEFDDRDILVPTPAADQIRTVQQWGDIEWSSMKLAFAGCSNLTINAMDAPNLSVVEDVRGMFLRASFTGNINGWNVSSVTNMEFMFAESSFNQDISDWNVSSVTDMHGMFAESSFNQDISNWNVSIVTNMQQMFLDTRFSGDISNWDVSSVTHMRQTFLVASFTPQIRN
ncbi:MAG: BspA family leucine-rich repeat surface protein, partial [Ekhidna sp.]|nr:BspA family leucine-rich repeat surface protein [Ekhidna sp.]